MKANLEVLEMMVDHHLHMGKEKVVWLDLWEKLGDPCLTAEGRMENKFSLKSKRKGKRDGFYYRS